MWIFLDDERFPADNANTDRWIICRTKAELIALVESSPAPIEHISFDHDLNDEDPSTTGDACAKWLIERDLDHPFSTLALDFSFHVHSQNPVGGRNIAKRMLHYLEYRDSL